MIANKTANPGSFIEFCDALGEDDKRRANQLYGKALDAYRVQLAVDYGVHPEDLHAMKLPEQRRDNEASLNELGGLAIEANQNQ